MATGEVIVYSFNEIEELAKTFHAELDQEVVNNLLEIKKNNKFIRRKSPLRLKYKISTANAWRNEREGQDISKEDKIANLLVSNLNKLSENNYLIIFRDIRKLYDDNIEDEDTIKLLAKIICDKAMTERLYSNLYAKLISSLENDNEGFNGLMGSVRDNCNNFFEKNINSSLKEISSNTDDYENICKILKDKSQFTGGFVFIANLFKYNIIDYDMVKQYYDSLVKYINFSPKDQIGRYLDAIISIMDNCGKDLETDNKEEFDNNYMYIIRDLSKNKEKVQAKYRFRLLDIIEKYENGWEDINNEGWQQV